MNKQFLFLLLFFSTCTISFGQTPNKKTLFVIDSVAVINDPDEDNQISDGDIADITYLRNKDSLKHLGFGMYNEVDYVFTKAYRNRPDNIKQIPSLNQLQLKDGVWYLNGFPYSGKYIDYYYCGKKLDEGMVVNGKLNGEVKVYFKDGQLKLDRNFSDGLEQGEHLEYFKNGILNLKSEYKDNKVAGLYECYFINGQIQYSNAFKKGTAFDTVAITYFSTGKIQKIQLSKKGKLIPLPNEEKLNYLRNQYQISARAGDLKNAIKYCSKIIELDSLDAYSYYNKGEALFKEYLFDEAILNFEKTIQLEPMSGAAFGYRAISRLKKHQFINAEGFTKEHKLGLMYAWVTVPIPADEQEKVCNDLQQASMLGIHELVGKGIFTEAISFYCNKK